ncbi:WxL domain-containing protein [Enterococcus malodoratus]|uniref:WxL domain-containing protein n=1 Tax=Enterococcus malodoratus ATCC 43197 TaxID=1158601 RepID=R2RA98_9ENTE|nr:WxL domain-containing protein [Enterococcus malodoratus]EOH77511.1 hypothetical protein UAI_02148 [Enterococcus malodoratus ATCC 43197]EOT64075.1 hypothetical protein I585_03272 [Enterococcus malodoratus ATCC 43197]SPX00921.1 WxL domain surface protein [Enterococcus malodoratus]STD66131.1 WxL domain surface protein [Enterococcus malodoratus]
MNKKIFSMLSVGIMVTSLFPTAFVDAETVEHTTASETTLSSIAEDPLKDKKNKAEEQVSAETETDSEAAAAEVVEETKDTKEATEESKEEVSSKEKKGATTLVEGVDIDADFAQALRTDSLAGNYYASWSGYGKNENELTIEDMEKLTQIHVQEKSLTSLKGIEYAVNVKIINCYTNKLTDVDLSKNSFLEKFVANDNQLTNLDVSSNNALRELYCFKNQLTSLNLDGLTNLEELTCYGNQLPTLDVSTNTGLLKLTCYSNQLPTIDLSNNKKLQHLNISKNKLPSLDVSKNINLTTLYCSSNQLPSLDVSKNLALKFLVCAWNEIPDLDVSKNSQLIDLACSFNKLTTLDLSQNPDLRMLQCYVNKLTELDMSHNPKLEILYCNDNDLTNLDVSQNPVLDNLQCGSNELTTLDVSNNVELTTLSCFSNHLSDITNMNGLAKLATLEAPNQTIRIPVPVVTDNKATVDVLKTTAHAGLTASNGFATSAVKPEPGFTTTGNVIELSNVTRLGLINKGIRFDYAGAQLSEGNNGASNSFSGTIYFDAVSEIENELVADQEKVKSGDTVEWTGTLTSFLPKKAENIHAVLDLPSGLTIDPDSIKIDGVAASLKDIDGTNNLGDLDQDEKKVITFKTKAEGAIDEELEAKGTVDWEDDTISSPYSKEVKGSVQIQKEDASKPGENDDDIALLTAPTAFNYGVQKIQGKETTYTLNPDAYKEDTDVVTNGFYTRMKDDRSTSTGWDLTAQLSDFTDSSEEVMPNSSGAAVKFDDLTIEAIANRDTPQEAVDTSATDGPSTVKASERLIAGDNAKTLVSAKSGEGKDTWQLRIPFEKVSLNLPANAGKKGSNYKAKLTWSLNDTP